MSDDDRDGLLYGGECPVCGRDYIDGFDGLEAGAQYNVDLCVVAAGDGDGEAVIHLPDGGELK